MNFKSLFVTFFTILWNFPLSESSQCGQRKVFKTSGLVFGGTASYAGKWPWFASLHLKKDEKYYCGATVINEKHLLTGE